MDLWSGTGKLDLMPSHFCWQCHSLPSLFALVTTQSILAYSKGLSVKLQGPYVDVARAHREIETVKAALQGIRSNVTTFHARVYAQASQMAQSVDVELSTPRLASRQQHRQNIPAQNSQDYFRLNLTNPLLDHLLSGLNSRFDAASSQNIMEFMRLSTISNFCCKARSTGL